MTAEKADLYRAVMGTFAAAKRQFRLHLRPDEVRAEALWPAEPATIEEIQQALAQLVEWGNLQAQPDTARVSTLEDFYRARFLYSLTVGGEATETGLAAFADALARRGALQSVALEDIHGRLSALRELAAIEPLDVPKIHETLRDLVMVFSGLAENAQAFMAGLSRTIELQRAELQSVMAYKTRLVDYLERFIGDLVTRSAKIAHEIAQITPQAERLLRCISEREAKDAAPDREASDASIQQERFQAWRERWNGLRGWFVSESGQQAQSELLRSQARAAIPRLLSAIAAINERRSGRSDRSADYRVLARWFAEARSDAEAHRLWRAGFALSPARHLSLAASGDDVPATTPWAESAPIEIVPRLRERGQLTKRGPPPRVRDRSAERELLGRQLAEQNAQILAARARLANGKQTRLSELGGLNRHEFGLFLALLGEALSAQRGPNEQVERTSADGSLIVKLAPLPGHAPVRLDTESGRFYGRDHLITISVIP